VLKPIVVASVFHNLVLKPIVVALVLNTALYMHTLLETLELRKGSSACLEDLAFLKQHIPKFEGYCNTSSDAACLPTIVAYGSEEYEALDVY
jgi:hypothetical protein